MISSKNKVIAVLLGGRDNVQDNGFQLVSKVQAVMDEKTWCSIFGLLHQSFVTKAL